MMAHQPCAFRDSLLLAFCSEIKLSSAKESCQTIASPPWMSTARCIVLNFELPAPPRAEESFPADRSHAESEDVENRQGYDNCKHSDNNT